LRWLETLTINDVVIEDYQCHPAIKYKMIAWKKKWTLLHGANQVSN
jgi:hypothetical protein